MQLAVKRHPIVKVLKKTLFLLWDSAEMGPNQCQETKSGSGWIRIFLLRSESLIELWQFRERFQPRIQIIFQVVAKSAGSENLILYLWIPSYSFEMADFFFHGKKGSQALVYACPCT
jgi:hypothetical protein